MKTIKVSKKYFKKVLKESIEENFDGSSAMKINYSQEPNDMIVEMSRINSNEQRGIFPYNAWEIKIWSNVHTPPHFHIIKDGWDVSFDIENGEILEIKANGNKTRDYSYMVQNVKKWMDSPSAILPMITNRQNAYAQWIQIHNGQH